MQLAIPQEWQDVLKEVQAVFPSAVIAGGALRDLMNNKPIKDVDIFVPIYEDYVGSLDAAYEAVWNMFKGETINLDPASEYHSSELNTDRDIHAIFDLIRGPLFEETQYDIILCKPEAALVHTFDINICQIIYDGKQVRFTGAYAHGILTRTIKVMNVNRTDRNQRRVERMQEKYTDFTVEQWNE